MNLNIKLHLQIGLLSISIISFLGAIFFSFDNNYEAAFHLMFLAFGARHFETELDEHIRLKHNDELKRVS